MRKSRKRLIVLCSLGFVCILACGGWFGWQAASDPDRLDYSQNVNPYEPLHTAWTGFRSYAKRHGGCYAVV